MMDLLDGLRSTEGFPFGASVVSHRFRQENSTLLGAYFCCDIRWGSNMELANLFAYSRSEKTVRCTVLWVGRTGENPTASAIKNGVLMHSFFYAKYGRKSFLFRFFYLKTVFFKQ